MMMTSALLVVSGCSKDNSDNSLQAGVETKTATLSASMVNLSKSLVDSEGGFCWTEDDAIAVNVSYTDEGGNQTNGFYKFEIKEISAENDNEAVFEGRIPASGTVTGFAVYPYDRGHLYADGKLTVNFPTEISESNHLPMMYAKIEGENLQFQHLSSMLKVTYRYVPYDTDSFTLTSDAVAGLYDVDLESGVLTASAQVTDKIQVPFTASVNMTEEKSFFVPVPAGERNISVSLSRGETLVPFSEFSSKSAREYVSGHITLLPTITVALSELFIVGASEDLYSWSTKKMKPMEKVGDHKFTWTGDIFNGDRFRFPLEQNFYPAIYKIDGKPQFAFENMGNNYDWTVDQNGNYTVTVDATNLDDIKVDVNFNYTAYPDQYLFITGQTVIMKHSNSAEDWMWMAQVEPGVFEWDGHLSDNVGTDFKFLTKSGSWYPSYNKDENADDDWTMIYRPDSNVPDKKFEITEGDGIYKVTANLNTMKVSCELLESCPRYYITGNSVGGFTKTPGMEYMFTYVSDGMYTWTGNLKVDTGNGFKIIEYGAYNPSWGPVGSATKEGDVREGTTEWNSTDRKWDLKSSQGFSEGEYTIMLDTKNGTISVTSKE